jgi:hypothetical protein
MTKVVNFFAGPSAGKTTNALGMSYHLKKMRKDILYVPEYAMYDVVQGHIQTLEDQMYVFGRQAKMLYDAKDRYEWVVTDGPLPLMLYYMKDANQKFSDGGRSYWLTDLAGLIIDTFYMYDNHNYFVNRGNREFRQLGRIHNLEQSVEIDKEIKDILYERRIEYTEISDLDQVIADLSEKGIL